MKVVALFRVSTERQADQGASLEAQERVYAEHASKSGWTTAATFKGAESATQAASDRRVLQQVLGFIREHTLDAIYVHEQSRLTRGDELEVALLMRELKERGLKILINGTVRDLSSIDERFMVGIQGVVDRAESERIKERMLRGKRQRAEQGRKSSGPAPFGFRNPHPGEPGRGTLVIVEAEAATIRRLFKLSAEGRGDRSVAVELNRLGLVSPRGGQWGKTSVRRALDNPAYIGTCASNVWVSGKGTRGFRFDPNNQKAIIRENAYPAIVTREVWDAVRARPKLPRTAVPRMLSGLLYVDNHKYEGDVGRGCRLYRAPKGVKGCPWLDAETVDGAVWDAFASLATSAEFVERLLAAAADPYQRQAVLQEIDHLNDQIGRGRRRLDRLLEMRADGEITKDEFLAKTKQTKEGIAAHDRELEALRGKAATMDTSQSTRVVKAVQTVLAGRTRLSGDQKRAVLRTIVRRVDVEAVRTGNKLGRDMRGRVLGGSVRTWGVSRVTFALSLPKAVEGPHAQTEPNRCGQSATTPLNSAQLPDSADRTRVGHLVRVPSCSAPPAAARP